MQSILGLFTASKDGREDKKETPQPRKNLNSVYWRPLPLEVYPLPAFIPSNPLSYLRIAYVLLSGYFNPWKSHTTVHWGYYSPATRSVHVTDENSIRTLWECGFFGKGSLSRSEPEWLAREKKRLGVLHEGRKTAGEVTNSRREERRLAKRERARVEREELEEQLRKEGKLLDALEPDLTTLKIAGAQPNGKKHDSEGLERPATATNGTAPESREQPSKISEQVVLRNHEHLQLDSYESFFLSYGLGVLKIQTKVSADAAQLGPPDLLELFRRTSTFPPMPKDAQLPPDDAFILSYVVYHHFRSLGWVVRPGFKFAVDWLLYARGPVFAHAEFAVVILPSYSGWGEVYGGEFAPKREHEIWRERGEWWWFHAASRVQTQVMKSLVLCYVEVPTPQEFERWYTSAGCNITGLLSQYAIREFVIRRWSPNRNRD